MNTHIQVLSRQDRLIDELRNKVGSPITAYADLFAGILGSLPVVMDRRTALRAYIKVVRAMLMTPDEDLIMSRYAYRNVRKAFYILLFTSLEELPAYLSSNNPYDPIPFFAAWRLAEGV